MFAPARLLTFFGLLIPLSAAAQVTVELQPGPGSQYAQSLGIDLAELEQQLEDDISEKFAAVNTDGFLKAFGNAEAFSAKGLGADYSSNPKHAVIGIGAGASIAFEDALDDPTVAPAVNASFLGGLNMGIVKPELKDLTLYVNFFHLKHSAFADTLSATLTNVGALAQYKLLRPSGGKEQLVLQWGGVDLTSGLQYTRASMSLGTDALTTELPVVGDQIGGVIQEDIVPFISTGKLDLTSDTFNIPFEASTNLRIAYFVTAFVGTGIDVQFGKTTMDVELVGDMEVEDPVNPGQNIDLGTGTVTVKGSSAPSPGTIRFFGGVQLNLWYAKLLLQVNARPAPASAGLTLAARVAW